MDRRKQKWGWGTIQHMTNLIWEDAKSDGGRINRLLQSVISCPMFHKHSRRRLITTIISSSHSRLVCSRPYVERRRRRRTRWWRKTFSGRFKIATARNGLRNHLSQEMVIEEKKKWKKCIKLPHYTHLAYCKADGRRFIIWTAARWRTIIITNYDDVKLYFYSQKTR